jgi:hypothetical protein
MLIEASTRERECANNNDISLTHCDLKLMDERFHINREGVQNYRACIIVQTNDVTDHKEKALMHQEYNRQAYRIAHRPRRMSERYNSRVGGERVSADGEEHSGESV